MISYSTIQGSYNVSYQTVLLLRKFIAQYKWAHAGLVGGFGGLVWVSGVLDMVGMGFGSDREGYGWVFWV